MVRRLPQLSWTQINYFDSSISPVRLAKWDSATVVRHFSKRRSMFNGLRKCHKNTDSPICQTLFSPWRVCVVKRRKSLLTSHSVLEMCFSCFINTKYKCLRCELPIAISAQIVNRASGEKGSSVMVSFSTALRMRPSRNINVDLFLFFAINCQRKARRALYFGISLASPRSN